MQSRAPHGARGLKHYGMDGNDFGFSRAPHGARGLKLVWYNNHVRKLESRPARGAWIETKTQGVY